MRLSLDSSLKVPLIKTPPLIDHALNPPIQTPCPLDHEKDHLVHQSTSPSSLQHLALWFMSCPVVCVPGFESQSELTLVNRLLRELISTCIRKGGYWAF